jgi:hypothetical protein
MTAVSQCSWAGVCEECCNTPGVMSSTEEVEALAKKVLAAAGIGDNHAVLGVSSTATSLAVKTAYRSVRALTPLQHPLAGGEPA